MSLWKTTKALTLALTGAVFAGCHHDKDAVNPQSGIKAEAADATVIAFLHNHVAFYGDGAVGRYGSEWLVADTYAGENAPTQHKQVGFNMLAEIVSDPDSADAVLNMIPRGTGGYTTCHDQKVVELEQANLSFTKPVQATDGTLLSEILSGHGDVKAAMFAPQNVADQPSETYLRILKGKELEELVKQNGFFERNPDDYLDKRPVTFGQYKIK